MTTTAPPVCPFCGAPLEPQACFGYLHHLRCQRCPSASCYEVFAGVARSVRCKGTTDIPKGERCEACKGTGIKPPKDGP